MNVNSTYAFYGSLRRGMSNYQYFESALRFHFQDVIAGFQLYEMEDYPYAIKTSNPSHLMTVEVFSITDKAIERSIHELEMEVGYYYDEVEIRGQNTGIYLFKNAGPERLVKSGDWVQFFGSRQRPRN